MSSAPHLTVASDSHIGRRKNNEDAAYATIRDSEEIEVACIAVADGMGGHAAGEEASRIAVERIAQLVRVGYDPGDDPILVFKQVYREINRRIAGYADEHPDAAGLGTTLVSAIVQDEVAHIFNVGDSRAYWFPESGAVQQITQDHSAAAEAVRSGEMTPEEAKQHPYAHALTHCLDGDGDGEPDYFRLELDEPGFLLLCSDGLTGALSDDEISHVLFGTAALDGPKGAAQQLTALAHQRGGRRQDNTTVAILEVGEVERDALITAVVPAPEPAEATAKPGLPRRKRVAAIVSALLFTALLFVGAYAWMGGATLPQHAGGENGEGSEFFAGAASDVNDDAADGEDADGEGADGENADGEGADGEDADGEDADGEDADGEDADGEGADGEDADGEDADGEGADGEDADGEGADGEGADGEDADDDAADDDAADDDAADDDAADDDAADDDAMGEITRCEPSEQGRIVPLRYTAASSNSPEVSPEKVIVIRRAVDAENQLGHGEIGGRFQPKRKSGPLVYPGSGIDTTGHCLYSGDVADEVPHSYNHGAGESMAYFYLVYALDTDGQLWVSFNERHEPDQYSWDAVETGEMTLRKATGDAGAEDVKDFIERIHQR